MSKVTACPIPESAYLQTYFTNNDFTDCYTCTVPIEANLEQFVAAFYTTWLFKLERFILKWAASRPSTDNQAMALAAGDADRFAAWSVEQRGPNQLLMCDFRETTRSWLMAQPGSQEMTGHTRLFFGSAVVAQTNPNSGKHEMSTAFRMLLGLHKTYSVALLKVARSKLLNIRENKTIT